MVGVAYARSLHPQTSLTSIRLSSAHYDVTYKFLPQSGYVLGPIYGRFTGPKSDRKFVCHAGAQVCITETLHPHEDITNDRVAARALEEEFGFGSFELTNLGTDVSQNKPISVWNVDSFHHLSSRRLPKKASKNEKVMVWFNPSTLEGAINIADQVNLEYIDSADGIVGIAVFDVDHVRRAYHQNERHHRNRR
jgi:hypothetical protein